ncbi:8-hydroxygeraniol dehydrogenase-like isoform X1 [Coffea arabica]|uniref:8-hydroxygeraniol dehydrogenase-like isoform X1 n=2 Tax=Coffea TaxID=13442 RepID=A0ABM4VAF4_COFAR
MGALGASCRNCEMCCQDLEAYCSEKVFTHGSIDKHGEPTQGGFCDLMVADEHFLFCWPENLPMDAGAPLLCAGITTYSSMRYFGLDKPGIHVGIVGLGGLGHLAVKFAKAFGAKVTVISTSASKRQEAITKLGADAFLVSSNPEQMQAAASTMDGILDTVSANHPIVHLINLVKPLGKFILLGLPEKPPELPIFPIIMGRKTIAGSANGGLEEIQQMINFAAEHNIFAEVEVIPIDYVNTAMERLKKGDIKYRFVIDIGNSLKSA